MDGTPFVSYSQAPCDVLKDLRIPPLKLRFESCGDDVPKFEPKTWLKFKDIDKSVQELRAMYKAHPEWFEVPKQKSDKGKNVVDY